MGEIEAAIAFEQYKKLKKILKTREEKLNYLTSELKKFKGLELPPISKKFNNNFYVYPIKLNLKLLKINRKKIVSALKKKELKD